MLPIKTVAVGRVDLWRDGPAIVRLGEHYELTVDAAWLHDTDVTEVWVDVDDVEVHYRPLHLYVYDGMRALMAGCLLYARRGGMQAQNASRMPL